MLRFVKIDVSFCKGVSPKNEFLGSTLRGAFGAALKRTVCVNPKYQCEDANGATNCKCAADCVYDEFFIRKNIYHAYRFSKPIGEDNYDFSFYLFEEACKQLPYILGALKEMASAYGFERDRQKPQIETIVCNDRLVYENDTFNLGEIEPNIFETPEAANAITLRFQTPLRMKSDNRLLASKPTLIQILNSILDRLNNFKGLPAIKLPFMPLYKEGKSDISFKDFARFSNRQQTKMQLGGIMGYICYDEIDAKSYTLLKLGEITGVGKQTVFGLGEIKVEENDSL